jgi:hypothetical protein
MREAALALLESWPMPKAREKARLALVAALRTATLPERQGVSNVSSYAFHESGG